MIWKWDTNVVASLDDNAGDSKSDSESELDSNKSTGSPESENGNEEDVQEIFTHTVSFKVIGCKKELIYQDVLEKCRDAMQDGQDIPVRLTPEPENPFDSRAIAFMCFMDEKWYRIGYVMSEILEEVHQCMLSTTRNNRCQVCVGKIHHPLALWIWILCRSGCLQEGFLALCGGSISQHEIGTF